MAAARGGLVAGVATTFGSSWAAGLAVAVLGFLRATDLTAAFGTTGFAAAGFGATAFAVGWAAGFGAAAFGLRRATGLAAGTAGIGWAAGFDAAALGVVCAGRLARAVGASGFAGAGFAAAGFVAAGFVAAAFADAPARGVAVFETARDFEASADAAFGLAFTISSLVPSLGSACSALGRRG